MADFVIDTFSSPNGTFTARTGETGAEWTAHPIATPPDVGLIQSGRYRPRTTGGCLYASGVPAGPEYDVQCDLVLLTDFGEGASIMGRIALDTFTCYEARYNGTTETYELVLWVDLTPTVLASVSAGAWAAGSRVMRLEIRNATKKIFIDGVEVCSSADNTITAAGHVGIGIRNASGSATGTHQDNFIASDFGSGGTPVESEPVDAIQEESVSIAASVLVSSSVSAAENQAASANISVRVFSQASATADESVSLAVATWSVAGAVTLNGSPVEGARVRLINMAADQYSGSTLTAPDGTFAFHGLLPDVDYHAAVEFESEGVKYNARSQPFLQATQD